jgi:hypothetical protein
MTPRVGVEQRRQGRLEPSFSGIRMTSRIICHEE